MFIASRGIYGEVKFWNSGPQISFDDKWTPQLADDFAITCWNPNVIVTFSFWLGHKRTFSIRNTQCRYVHRPTHIQLYVMSWLSNPGITIWPWYILVLSVNFGNAKAQLFSYTKFAGLHTAKKAVDVREPTPVGVAYEVCRCYKCGESDVFW